MATGITTKEKPLFIRDSMATYNHMEDEQRNNIQSAPHTGVGQQRFFWSIVLEETLIAILTMTLIWVSLT